MKLTPELSNPYVPGRCWRKISDSFNGINFCNGYPVQKYRVTKDTYRRTGNIPVEMHLCAKCADYMKSHGYQLSQ